MITNAYNTISEQQQPGSRIWFIVFILFLLVDVARVHDILSIGSIRPAMILILVMSSYVIMNYQSRYFENRQIKLIVYFVLLVSAYIPFAVNNYFAFLMAKSMWLLLPFIFSLLVLINSQERLATLLKYYVGIMIFLSIYGIFHEGRGPGGGVGDENDLTLFFVTILPFSFVLISMSKSIFMRLLLFAGILSTLISFAVSSSRGGFVGLIAASIVGWLYSTKKIILLIGLLLLAGVIYVYSSDTYREEISDITNVKENTAQTRILTWKAAVQIFLDNPLGVGGGNFPIYFPEYQSSEFPRSMWGRVAHSLWFTLISELGIIGTMIFISIIIQNIRDISFLRNNYQKMKSSDSDFFGMLSVSLYASMAGFLASATFLSVLYYPHFWYLTALIVSSRRIAESAFQQQQVTV